MYKSYIKDDIVEKQLRDKYGYKKNYKLKIDVEYQSSYKNIPIDILFTQDKKAMWIAKFKGEYYMSIVDDIKLTDDYTVLDIYTTLEENAKDSLKVITKTAKK